MPFLLITWLFFVIHFRKTFNNFFSLKITNNVCPRHNIFRFFNHKFFFWQIWSVTCSKNIFIFWYSKIVTNFKFRSFIINFFTIVNMFDFTLKGLILIVLWSVLLHLLTILFTLSILKSKFTILKSCIYKSYFLRF